VKTYSDIVGDGGSDVLGQVQALHRSIGDALAGVDHLVAVGSGKGGVGKSTVTMALAQALRRRGEDVAILDADFNGPCQARLAGLTGTPWVPGEGGLALPRREDGLGVVSMGSLLEDSRPLGFDSVARGESFTWRATREFSVLAQLLASVDWGRLDVLLFDLPPGAERTLQYAEFFSNEALGSELHFVMVDIPSEISRGVVARSLTVLEEIGSDVLGVVENMAGYYCRECETVQPLFPRIAEDDPAGDESGSRNVPTLGHIPFDPALAALCDRGWPAGETDWATPSLAAVDAVAGQLVDALRRPPEDPSENPLQDPLEKTLEDAR
jgi:ATP-binding protein involved in chromosome partitioning